MWASRKSPPTATLAMRVGTASVKLRIYILEEASERRLISGGCGVDDKILEGVLGWRRPMIVVLM